MLAEPRHSVETSNESILKVLFFLFCLFCVGMAGWLVQGVNDMILCKM
jgi:hypothetical protein